MNKLKNFYKNLELIISAIVIIFTIILPKKSFAYKINQNIKSYDLASVATEAESHYFKPCTTSFTSIKKNIHTCREYSNNYPFLTFETSFKAKNSTFYVKKSLSLFNEMSKSFQTNNLNHLLKPVFPKVIKPVSRIDKKNLTTSQCVVLESYKIVNCSELQNRLFSFNMVKITILSAFFISYLKMTSKYIGNNIFFNYTTFNKSNKKNKILTLQVNCPFAVEDSIMLCISNIYVKLGTIGTVIGKEFNPVKAVVDFSNPIENCFLCIHQENVIQTTKGEGLKIINKNYKKT